MRKKNHILALPLAPGMISRTYVLIHLFSKHLLKGYFVKFNVYVLEVQEDNKEISLSSESFSQDFHINQQGDLEILKLYPFITSGNAS